MNSEYETGRPGDVNDDLLANVHDHNDVARVIEQMRSDLREHPDEWENPTLDR
jgi:hypothetical protein